MSDSVRPHRWQPTRLPCPWDSPGKNTGVSCHFLQCMKVKSESEVAQSCPTPSNPMDCSPPGPSVHGIFQARVLKWGAITFSELHSLGKAFQSPSFSVLWLPQILTLAPIRSCVAHGMSAKSFFPTCNSQDSWHLGATMGKGYVTDSKGVIDEPGDLGSNYSIFRPSILGLGKESSFWASMACWLHDSGNW